MKFMHLQESQQQDEIDEGAPGCNRTCYEQRCGMQFADSK